MINFQITNSIVNKLEKISAIWGVIENAKIVPEWEQKLIKIARLRSGVFSTRIEGNQIDLQDAEKFIIEGKTIDARPRDKQELKNYMEVLNYVETEQSTKNLTDKQIFKIHCLTVNKILSKGLQNKYRDQQNAIYNRNGGIVYMPPEYKDVSPLMQDLLNFINTKTEVSPLIRAAILHHWFVIIHPFIDGNGRTSRALTQLFLYQNGFNTKKYFSLEEYYDSDLQNYYKSLNIGANNFYDVYETNKIDSTLFIEYFLSGMLHELERLKKQITSIKEEELFEKHLAEQNLTNRQVHFMIFIKEKGKAKSSDFLKKFNLSLASVKREIKILIEKNIIKSYGSGKNTFYEPNMSRI